MNIALSINGFIRDIHREITKVRLYEEDDFNSNEHFNPYDYLLELKSKGKYDDFLFYYGREVFGSRVSFVDNKIGLNLFKFLNWAKENSYTVTIGCDSIGTEQIHTLNCLAELSEGNFTTYQKIDFELSKNIEHYDLVFTDSSLGFSQDVVDDNLRDNIILINTPYTENIAVHGIKDFDTLREFLKQNGNRK